MSIITKPQPTTPIAWGQGTRHYKRFHTPKASVSACIADHLRRDPAPINLFALDDQQVAQLIEEKQAEGQYVMDERGRLAPELSKDEFTKLVRTLRARVMA